MTPLGDVRVLDLTRLLPGGYATLLLADLGADVVKIEEPGKGDYIRWMPPSMGEHSAAHIALNRNKRSLTLNLRTEQGRDLLRALAQRYDVLVESFRPRVMDGLGVGYADLQARNPALVYCAITGYGQDGPRAEVAGHDADYIAYAGALSITGPEEGAPVLPGVQIGDLGGGGMAAAIAILAALHRRGQTGAGDFCDLSMSDGVFSWLAIHAAEFEATREIPRRGEMTLSGKYPCYRIYPAADGHLAVGALEPQFWRALCEALGRPEFNDDGFAVGRRRDEVVTRLEALFETRTRAEWMAVVADVDACIAPVNDLAETFDDEQLRHRGMMIEAEAPGFGPWRHIGNPIRMAGAPSEVLRLPPPGLGEHSEEVLAEVGVDGDEVEQLRARGVV